MINKKAYSVQMSFKVPDSEKQLAEKAEEQFESLLANIKVAVEYLEHIYLPFKKYDNLDMGEIAKYRETFYQYRDEVKKRFDAIIKKAFHCIKLMNNFGTDTPIQEMMDAFSSQIKELDKFVELFVSIFSDLNDPEIKKDIVSTVDSIKKSTNQIRQLVNDRILEHIDNNILAKNWTSDLSEKYQENVEQRIPLVVQLFNERQKALQENKGRKV